MDILSIAQWGISLYWLVALGLLASSYALKHLFPMQSVRSAQLLGFWARSLLFLAGLTISCWYGMTASIVLFLIGKPGLSQWTTGRFFKWIMWPTVGVWFEIDDQSRKILEEPGPVIFVANHQSALDVLLLGHVFTENTTVTAKKELIWVPFLGQFMYLSNTIFIDRKKSKNAIAAMDQAAQKMKSRGQRFLIFPEGTRSDAESPTLLRFGKGAFHMALSAKVPIVPVVCANYSSLVHWKSRRFEPGTIPVRVLKPISTEKYSRDQVEELTNLVHKQMLQTLSDLHVENSTKSKHS